jgi:hypothetical protein
LKELAKNPYNTYSSFLLKLLQESHMENTEQLMPGIVDNQWGPIVQRVAIYAKILFSDALSQSSHGSGSNGMKMSPRK